MFLSNFIIKKVRKIQRKPLEERKKIQLWVVIFFLFVFLLLGILSFNKNNFAQTGNPFSNIRETEEAQKVTGLVGKIKNISAKIKDSFKSFKENEEVKIFFEKHGS
jgi:preprotein translocase subunit YajC